MICTYCGVEHEAKQIYYIINGVEVCLCEECTQKQRNLGWGFGLITDKEREEQYNNSPPAEQEVFITYKPFTDRYALGSLREPKTFSSHTAWENHANKMNPGAYVNHKE